MAIEPITLTENAVTELISNISSLSRWIIGGFGFALIIWVIFHMISIFLERKKVKTLREINSRLERIEKNLEKKR